MESLFYFLATLTSIVFLNMVLEPFSALLSWILSQYLF
jgi:hypothetical protein